LQWPDQETRANGERSPVNPVMAPPGPCWRCGAYMYGHLAASCTATKQYPFSQHVVDSTQHVVDSTRVSNVDAVQLLPCVSCVDEMALSQLHLINVLIGSKSMAVLCCVNVWMGLRTVVLLCGANVLMGR